MTYDEMNLKYDEIKAQAIPGLILSRPDGYNGSRVNVQIALIGNNVIEISPTGCYRCPAVSCALDITELNWLIDNHPGFKSYNRI